MKILQLLLPCALAAVTASCATADLSPPRVADALLPNYRAEAERVVKSGLRDPASATFDFREEPYILVCDRGTFGNPTNAEVWAAEVWVNARNGYGGYTGPQPYTVVFVKNEVTGEVMMRPQLGQRGGRTVAATGICKPKA